MIRTTLFVRIHCNSVVLDGNTVLCFKDKEYRRKKKNNQTKNKSAEKDEYEDVYYNNFDCGNGVVLSHSITRVHKNRKSVKFYRSFPPGCMCEGRSTTNRSVQDERNQVNSIFNNPSCRKHRNELPRVCFQNNQDFQVQPPPPILPILPIRPNQVRRREKHTPVSLSPPLIYPTMNEMNSDDIRFSGKKRKLNENFGRSRLELICILPNRGSTLGGLKTNQLVNVYFYYTPEIAMHGLLAPIPYLRFGDDCSVNFGCLPASLFGRFAESVTENKYINQYKKKDRNVYEDCTARANLYIGVYPPPHEAGYVDVGLVIFNGSKKETSYKKDAFYYEQEKKNTDSGQKETVDNFESDRSEFGKRRNIYPEFDNSIAGFDIGDIDFGNIGMDLDQFSRSMLFYLVAQNVIEKVKYLVEERKFDIYLKDVFGNSLLDICNYFERKELFKYLSGKMDFNSREDLKKLKCGFCSNRVNVSGNQKITHICWGKTKKSNVSSLDFEEMKIYYLETDENQKSSIGKVNFAEKKKSYEDFFSADGKLSDNLKVPKWSSAFLRGRKIFLEEDV